MNLKKSIILFSILALCSLPDLHAQKKNSDNEYGVDEANTKFMASGNELGGREDYDCMALKNHPDISGVPLGGVGVGNVNFTPSGLFNRIGINNIHTPIKRSEGCFFAIWYRDKSGTVTKKLVRNDVRSADTGMDGVSETYYKGLFPIAELSFGSDVPGKPVIKAYSGLVPHDIKNSSLPVAWFDIMLESEEDAEVSVAFSWEDFIGLYKDPVSVEGMNGQILSKGRNKLLNGESWPMNRKPETKVEQFGSGRLTGLRQYHDGEFEPLRWTYQNYVNNVIIAAEKQTGQTVSFLGRYDGNSGTDAWKSFTDEGAFSKEIDGSITLSEDGGKSGMSAVAVKTRLKKGQKKTIRFMLVWYAPEITIDTEKTSPDRYWTYNTDYNKYYHNYFNDYRQLADYAQAGRKEILEKTEEWHRPVLSSTLPDWYKFKLINSGYVIYTNMVLNKRGDVMVNEGAMGGLAGTMDQRLSAHPFYQKFFTGLDRSEMNIFADSMDPEGYILHFIGHYYGGMGSIGARVPTEKGHMLDNSSSWIIQLVKDYEQTGDFDYLESHIAWVEKVMEYLDSCKPEGSEIPVGKTTYDDYEHPPLYSYYAGVWLATLKAYEKIGIATGREDIVKYAKSQFNLSYEETIDKLWNGKFFAYGCEPDGSKRLDCILFTGQLAGQFISRYCGWGDIYPLKYVESSLCAQFDNSLSSTPDYYANKVWDLNLGRGIDRPGSQCWPFYLESYTGLAAMQAGYYEDAMEIMRHIQLVHLRKGYTWTQNLWNPRDVTYMTAPVTWFSTDVLAGSGLDIANRELRLAPIVPDDSIVRYPVFFPKFWAEVCADPVNRKLTFKIIKDYSNSGITIDKIRVEPSGYQTSYGNVVEIPQFTVKEGLEIDLSASYDQIVKSSLTSQRLR